MRLLFVLLILALPSWAVTFTKTASVTVTHATGTSASQDTTGAKLLLANAVCFSNDPVAPTDSKGNTWTATTLRSSANSYGKFFYVLNPTVGTGHTFTSTNCAGSETTFFSAWTWDTTDVLSVDTAVNDWAAASGDTITLPSVTPTTADDIIFVGTSINSTVVGSINSSFTIIEHLENTSFEDGLLAWRQYGSTTPLVVTVTYTSAGSSVGYILGFKLSAPSARRRQPAVS